MFFCRWNKLVKLVCNPIAQVHFGLKKLDMRRVTNHLINWLLLQLPWIISKKSIWNLCCSITEEILDDLTPLCSSCRWLPSSVQIYPHNLLLIYLHTTIYFPLYFQKYISYHKIHLPVHTFLDFLWNQTISRNMFFDAWISVTFLHNKAKKGFTIK